MGSKSSSYDSYNNYVEFLKANGVLNSKGDLKAGNFGIFYECLSCGRTRISKVVLDKCHFCSSCDIKVHNMFSKPKLR